MTDVDTRNKHSPLRIFFRYCRNLILSDSFSASSMTALACEQGMTPMIESCLRLVEEGRTTHEELLRVLGDG